ncbi:MAG: hypothetical protein K8U57_15850 [Planctomycetes bacterium]|nr:hypothetical protein [Planctomycetota bacterium]
MRACAILAVLFAASVVIAEEKPVVKELSTKELKIAFPEKGKAGEPTTITSAEELAKSLILKDAADAVQKQIDFKTEKLLAFAWAGSGQDMLAVTAKSKDSKTLLTIAYTPGRTRDLRQHAKLFVVPKDAEIAK